MDGNFYDLPFLVHSSKSDFACDDGEISLVNGFECHPVDNVNIDEKPATGSSFVFKKDYIRTLPPVPEIEFSLLREAVRGWHLVADQYPSKLKECDDPSLSAWAKEAASCLNEFCSDARRQSLFIAPFFAIAVWKTVKGRYLCPSPPVLLIPDSEAPVVTATGSPDSRELELRIVAVACSLCYRISAPEILRDWIGKIMSLEIMVSSPFSLYDPKKTFTVVRNYKPSYFTLSKKTLSDVPLEETVCTDTLEIAWIPPHNEAVLTDVYEFYDFASVPFDRVLTMNQFKKATPLADSLEYIFSGEKYIPSYSQPLIKGGEGAIDYKERRIIWNPTLAILEFYPLKRIICEAGEGVLPRWIFIPDSKAGEYQFTDETGKIRSIPLKTHPRLFGSFYFGGFISRQNSFQEASSVKTGVREEKLKGYIYDEYGEWITHEADKSLQNLKIGDLKAVLRAFRSSGLVATVLPTLYVFSSEGIFLFKETSEGVWGEAGLIARYLLKDAETLTIYPRSITFQDENGAIIEINGTKVINRQNADSENTLKTGLTIYGIGQPGCLETRPIKLSKGGILKKIGKVFLRGNFNKSVIDFSIFGSNDMTNWILLGKRRGAVITVSGKRNRFFKIRIVADLNESETLEGISLQLHD